MTDNKKLHVEKHIVVMGMKHCGKTTKGKLLAQQLGIEFVDIDHLIEFEYDPDRQKTVREIYRNDGVEVFRDLEALSTEKLCSAEELTRPRVIGFGGSTIENERAMRAITGKAVLVYMDETPDVLFERIKRGGIPPFLSQERPYEDFLELYNKRTKTYEKKADLIINIHDLTVEQCVDAILKELKESGYAG